jgi:two-component system heavy metal sensor histidine kinase CusS
MSSTTAPEPSRWSLAARLTLWSAASSFLLVLGATGFLYWALHANLDREDDQHLANKVHTLKQMLREHPEGSDALRREVQVAPAGGSYARFWCAFSTATVGHCWNRPAWTRNCRGTPFLPGGGIVRCGRERRRRPGVPAGSSPYAPTEGASSRSPSTRATRRGLAGYRRNLYAVLAVSLVVCAVVSYLIARGGLQPLTRITAAAAGVRATTLNQRLRTGGPPAELFGLATTFNEMLGRLKTFSRPVALATSPTSCARRSTTCAARRR